VATLPAPRRWYITAFDIVTDALLEKVAPAVAYAQLVAAVPFLANPVTRWLVNWLFGKLEERVDVVGKKGLLRLGNNFRKMSFDEAMKVLREHEDDLTQEQLAQAREAAIRLIRRGST
jgi:hypothetical protein